MDPERYASLKPPVAPEGFSYRDVWFDLSPLRPDEYGKQVAAKWERAEQVQGAFSKGRRLEKANRQHAVDSKKRSEAAIELLKERA